MKRGMTALALGLAAGLAWMVSTAFSASSSEAPAGGTRVAVIDLVRVFNEFKQTRALNQKMQEYRTKLGEEKDKRIQDINAGKAALDAFTPDSSDWYKRNEELKKQRFSFEVWQAIEMDNLAAHHLRWTKRTYQMVTEQIAAIAKRRGAHLVITREEIDTPSTTDTAKLLQAMDQQILNRKVVYSDPAIEISDEVLAELNAAFEKAGGEKALDVTK